MHIYIYIYIHISICLLPITYYLFRCRHPARLARPNMHHTQEKRLQSHGELGGHIAKVANTWPKIRSILKNMYSTGNQYNTPLIKYPI